MNSQTLSECIDKVQSNLDKGQIAVDDGWRNNFQPIKYNEVFRTSFPILTIKGKKTKKYYQVIITRLDSGLYELVDYAN
jgi:hypothetical protein